MPEQEAAQGLDHLWPTDRWPGSLTDDWTVSEAFASMGHYVALSLFLFPCTELKLKHPFFLPGLVGTSQSDQKQFLETEKDSLIINQTKSPFFLKSSEYANLYEKITLPFSVDRASCSWEHLDLNVFSYNVCWCCLPDYI